MSSNLQVSPSTEQDLARLAQILTQAFSYLSWMSLVGYTNDPSGHALYAANQLAIWESNTSNILPSIKCTYTDPTTGDETIIAAANWIFHTTPRSENEYSQLTPLMDASWVEDKERREQARTILSKAHERQTRWMGGRPYAELHFLCTDPDFERKGAGTALVRWGVERCRELGIPAWADASIKGKGVYEREGFVVVEGRGTMVWWPEGWAEEEKRMALPGWRAKDGGKGVVASEVSTGSENVSGVDINPPTAQGLLKRRG